MDTTQNGGVADDDRTDHTERVTEPFDQTNGLVDGLEGESDGTADGEEASGADREQEAPEVFGILKDGGAVTPADPPDER